jgi:Tfp pilus assembly protein PilE
MQRSDVMEARAWLSEAIKRHERHMNGTEATSSASQQQMMKEMQNAMSWLKKALGY